MPKSKPPNGEEFWAEAVRLVKQPGNTMTSVARDLGVSMEGLRRHVRQAEIEAGVRDGLSGPSWSICGVGCGPSRPSARSCVPRQESWTLSGADRCGSSGWLRYRDMGGMSPRLSCGRTVL